MSENTRADLGRLTWWQLLNLSNLHHPVLPHLLSEGGVTRLKGGLVTDMAESCFQAGRADLDRLVLWQLLYLSNLHDHHPVLPPAQ